MKSPTLIVLAVLAIASTGSVLAAQPAAADGAAKPERKPLDANGDGFVDRAEAAAFPRLAARFDELDKNKDGRLDKDELPRREHGRRHGGGRDGHAGLQKLDTDKDGRISRAEAAADPAFAARFDQRDLNKDGFIDKADRELAATQRRDAWFKAADTDGDGKLSRAEFDAAGKQRAARRDGRHGHRQKHGPHAARGEGFAGLDKDKDGRISRAEAAGSPLAARFDSLDTNKDGFVDRDELKAGRPQRR